MIGSTDPDLASKMERAVAHVCEGDILWLNRQGLDNLSELHSLRNGIQHAGEQRLTRRPERSRVCGKPCCADVFSHFKAHIVTLQVGRTRSWLCCRRYRICACRSSSYRYGLPRVGCSSSHGCTRPHCDNHQRMNTSNTRGSTYILLSKVKGVLSNVCDTSLTPSGSGTICGKALFCTPPKEWPHAMRVIISV